MSEVTLAQILLAREERAQLQQNLLHRHGCPVLSFTMNIAGPVKNTPLIRRGFQAGLEELERRLPKNGILERMVDMPATGCQALYAVQMDAFALKDLCVAIEESAPIGRLFDMDVLDADGKKLERPTLRGCLVCGAPGRGCAAGRVHSATQLQEVTKNILRAHFARTDREQIASAAVQSLIDEVNTTPKPGLVDRRNNGSHKDMTVRHFLVSADALRPYFSECVEVGQETAHLPAEDTFPLLRQAGLAAEKAMYQATGGVNTHKGAIYTLGVLCGAIGRLWSAEDPIGQISDILAECAKLVRSSVNADLAAADGSTAGEMLYLKYGIGGIRAEVAAGLPSVADIGLTAYRKALADGHSPNDAGALALLHLIARVEDTNLYHRGGKDGAQWAAQAANALLQSDPTVEKIEALDDAFIARNLSPGGCADLLAVTYFLHRL